MTPLTERQQAVLDAIRVHIAEYGRPPTLRWLGERLGIASTNGVNDHLKALERKGFLLRDPGIACGIHLVGEAESDRPKMPQRVFIPQAIPMRYACAGIQTFEGAVIVNGVEIISFDPDGADYAEVLADRLRMALRKGVAA